ncbi:MAG: hypothetical protein P8Y81_16320, partial [Ignavibacteriaceae bacterium]
MKVLKFGGSSIGDADRIKNVIEIVKNSIQKNKRIVLIFSAFYQVTDNLLKMSQVASEGNSDYKELFKKLEEKHIFMAKKLLAVKTQSSILAQLKLHLNELEDVLHGVFLVKEISSRTQDFILSFGERLSTYIVSHVLIDQNIACEFLDSRSLLKTDESFGAAKVDFNKTYENICTYFSKHKKLQVVTGFIGSTYNNETPERSQYHSRSHL